MSSKIESIVWTQTGATITLETEYRKVRPNGRGRKKDIKHNERVRASVKQQLENFLQQRIPCTFKCTPAALQPITYTPADPLNTNV